MAVDVAPDALWSRLSELIAHKTGLHFPVERRADLLRGLTGAAQELGFADAAACAEGLLSSQLTREQLHVLAGHLTIGETYFFRDRNTFDALAEHVLPELMRKRGGERRLSVWSAACCTGEEAYSLAILLQNYAPGWRITLLATDLNERYLEKARAGVYGEWSFRDAPVGLKARYFTRTAEGRYALLPQVKQMVRFERFNLVQDSFPAPGADLPAMDLILCRNVLMYFTPPQAERVLRNLHGSLREDGWLVVAASEGSHSLLPHFTPVNFPGAILYQKATSQPRNGVAAHAPTFAGPVPLVTPVEVFSPSEVTVAPAVRPERTREAAPAPAVPQEEVHAIALEARSLANEGRLAEALVSCDRWIAADTLDGAGRYLRAVILQELGERELARRAFQQTVYLQPDFVLAHVALGNLARAEGRIEDGNKHYGNALTLLRRCGSEDVLPQSDGLTAGRLREIVLSLLGSVATS